MAQCDTSFARGLSLFLFTMAGCASTEVATKPAAPLLDERLPSVTATPPRLLRAPTVNQLAAYACSLGVSDTAVRQDCLTAFGPPPPYSQLGFQFGTTVTISNRRNAPLTLASLRVLLKLFPGEKEEGVGTICLRMCPSEERSCTGSVAPDGCSSSDGPVLRAGPAIAQAIPGLIIGPTQPTIAVELRKMTAAPNEDIKLELAFDLASDPMLQVLHPALKKRMQNLSQPDLKEFQLPLSIEGGVFVRPADPARNKERIGVWFGPVSGLVPL